MKTDGLFTVKVVERSFQDYNKPINLWLPADIHHNSRSHASGAFEDFLKEASSNKEQNLFLSLGDTLDTCSDSERRFLASGGLHDDSFDDFDEMVEAHTERYIKQVLPVMGGKCIGCIGGNHTWKHEDGTNTEQRIARALKAPYLGDAAFICLVLRYRNTSYTHEVVIFANHTSADSKLKALGLRVDADLVVGAHTHRGFIIPEAKLRLRRKGGRAKVIHHETRIIRAQCFLRAYADNQRSYAIRSAYSPATIGCARAVITPRRVEVDKSKPQYVDERWVDIKAVI